MKKLIFFLFVAVILFSCDTITSPYIPNIPYNLQVEVLDANHINLSWGFNGGSIGDSIRFEISKYAANYGYNYWYDYYDFVYDENDFYDQINTADSVVYAYRVKATNLTIDEDYAYSTPVAYFSPQAIPSDLVSYQVAQDTVLVMWDDNSLGEEGYQLEKRTDDGDWVTILPRLSANREYYLDNVQAFEKIEYKVSAFFSESYSVAIHDSIYTSLGAPSNLQLSKPDPNKIRLNWQDRSNGESGFYIDRKLGELDWELQVAQVGENITEFIDDIEYPSATLQYRVYSYYENYYSNYSNEESINVRLELIGEYQTPGDALDVEVNNLIAYVADNYSGVQVINCYSPNDPELITEIQIPDRTLDASLEGSFLFVTSNSGHAPGLISKIDLTDQANPYLTGDTAVDGIPNGICSSGDHAYIASGTEGMVTAYISSADPVVANSTLTGGLARKVTVQSHYVYVTNGLDGFAIIDIFNPADPQLLNIYPTSGVANNIAVEYGIAAITKGEDGVDFYNVSNPSSATFISNFSNDGFIYDVAIRDNYAYLIDRDNGVIVLDITDINNPYQMGNYRMETNPVSLYDYGSYLFITDEEGLKIVQVRS